MLLRGFFISVCLFSFSGFAASQDTLDLEKTIRQKLRDFEFKTESVKKFGPNILPILEKLLMDSTTDPDHVSRALSVVKELREDRSQLIPAVLSRLSDEFYVVRNISVQILGDTGDSRYSQYLIVMLSDSDFTVAVQASVALSKIGDINTVRAMDLWLKRTKFSEKPMSISLKERVTKSRNELVERLKKELK